MLTDPKLRAQIDGLWNRLWSGGLVNPFDAIEQLSFLIFLKRLDDREDLQKRAAERQGHLYLPALDADLRWDLWTRMTAEKALDHLKNVVFPKLRKMGGTGSSFARHMQNAECKINKPGLLIEACNLINELDISGQNQDVQGDMYEYMLGYLNIAGRGGQFRSPRHIIRMMVRMIDPKPGERMADLAAGTCGFPVNVYQYVLETHTSPDILVYDEQGWAHNLLGDLLTPAQRKFLQESALRAYDNDSGLTMHRIGTMNLMLHGIEQPHFEYMDTLSKKFVEAAQYDLILMNPPFTGAVDKDDVSPTLPGDTRKSELLFVHLVLRALEMGGRCAIIVPDGVLFGSSRAHVALRKKLVEENRLDGVVSMPGGVFKPYAGVSTAVLFFTRGASTDDVWFYDMAHDGFSLDDKRQPIPQNDIPDILDCWRNRRDPAFLAARQARLEELRAQVAPLKTRRLVLHAGVNRLTFDSVLAPDDGGGDGARAALKAAQDELAALEAQISPAHAEIDQLTRQFWVPKKEIKAHGYDLSASRYRQAQPDETYYEKPDVTLERLLQIEEASTQLVRSLGDLLRHREE